MRLKRNEKGEEGFTLIELLVLIVFVGVVVAIFFPAAFRHRSYCPPPGRVPRPAHCFGQMENPHPVAFISGDEPVKSGVL